MTEPAPERGLGSRDVEEPWQRVVATAGHVDHGKSSLVLRLTGMEPDRLAEEKRRGLTIELGYAWTTLPSGREVAFVDVPGHERFVRTMLAGVGPVRLVLFVVAADEGWKPQSEEHLAIVDLLGVDGAVVALSKSDAMAPADLALVESQVRERLAGTSMHDAPLVACSALTGSGMADLIEALDRMVAQAPRPQAAARSRLFVDRIFSMRGAGTIVTGTLTGAPLAVGDDVTLMPSGETARIRALQMHRRDVEVARPVARVAANLSTDRGRVRRGEILTRPGDWVATAVLETWIRTIRSRPSLSPRGAFKLYAGAAERDARIRLFDGPAHGPEGSFARITLSAPLVVDVGDPFVLRDAGRRATVAGGVVLDPHPPKRAGTDATGRLSRRWNLPREELPAVLVIERRAVRADVLERELGVAPDHVPGARRAGAWWVAEDVRTTVATAVRARLAHFHDEDPVAVGRDLADVRGSAVRELRVAGAPSDDDLAGALIDGLLADGELERDGAVVRVAGHAPELGADETRLVAAVAAAEPTPPTMSELREAGFSRSLVDAAVRTGRLVRVSQEVVLTSEFVERARDVIAESGDEGVTVSALRVRLGTSRKYAVPLLEHLDRSGVTRRSGDVRTLRTRPER